MRFAKPMHPIFGFIFQERKGNSLQDIFHTLQWPKYNEMI